ncbi:MAG: radical SAM protein [bacterium]
MDTYEDLRLSRFVHFYSLGEYTAVYNALNLSVLFLEEGVSNQIKSNKLLGSNAELQVAVEQMKGWRMLVPFDYDEMLDYLKVRESLEDLSIGILYLLLTDACNFACKYCFIEGARAFQKKGLMTNEVARLGINTFIRALSDNPHPSKVIPQVIFYGGEPLINFDCLLFALEYIKSLQQSQTLPENLTLTINTNASLVTSKIAQALAEYKVRASISVDGTPEVHNSQRVFHSGKGTFESTEKGLRLLQEFGVETSVSFTITWNNLKHIEESLLWLVKELNVKSLGFNIHRDSEMIKVENSPIFAREVSDALIRCFKLARELGIYEDRMMRKVKAFVAGQPYLNDCGGCGQQVVVSPNGELGVCHVLSPNGDYYIPYTPNLNTRTHPYWIEWRKRSPFLMNQCVDCIALGICGGGCPQQALLKQGSIWGLDEVFCVHAKTTLDFLLKDLLEKTLIQGSKNVPTVSKQ